MARNVIYCVLFVLFCFLFSGTAYAQSVSPEVMSQIKAKAKKEWPDDYSTRLYVIKQEVGAYKKLQRMTSVSDIPTDVLTRIKSKAKKEWPADYSTRLYVIKQEIQAYRELHSIKSVN